MKAVGKRGRVYLTEEQKTGKTVSTCVFDIFFDSFIVATEEMQCIPGEAGEGRGVLGGGGVRS